jgi:membrane-associated protein
MHIFLQLIDLFLHIDRHLETIINDFQTGTYLILFLIIFMETGLVVTPFLPGDSLIFAAAAFAARPGSPLNIIVLYLILCVAAIAGDTANYWIGHTVGPRAFSGNIRFLKKEYLDRTHDFYERHGGKTIILARFIPIIRTFAPFVAGIGAMTYPHFIAYNVVGGIAWVSLFTFCGYFFGELTFVKNNFSFVVLAIIIISVLPGVIEFVRERRRSKRLAQQSDSLNVEG